MALKAVRFSFLHDIAENRATKMRGESDRLHEGETAGFKERKILEISQGLCEKLGVTRTRLESVEWRERFSSRRFSFSSSNMIPFDGCAFKNSTLLLPTATRDILEPEEWAPLIASELIYTEQFRRRRITGLLMRLVTATLAYALVPVVLWQFGILNLNGDTTFRGQPIPLVVAFADIYSLAALVFVSVMYLLLGDPYIRKLRLLADRRAANLLGKDVFTSALQKIGRSFPKIMAGKRPSSNYPTGRTSIQQRLRNLDGGW